MSFVDARVPLELSRQADRRDVTRVRVESSAGDASAGAGSASAPERTSITCSSTSLVSTL
jgi:hypothetical protein